MASIKDALRKLDEAPARRPGEIRVIYSTPWTRQMVERDAKGDADAKARDIAQSVAVAQPHRADADDPADPMLGSALGRYCLRRWPGKGNQDMRRDRFQAGNMFAEKIDADRSARGLKPRIYGEAQYSGNLTDEQLRARRELAAMQRADAEAEVRRVADRAVNVMTRLCWEDQEIGPYDEGIVYNALYKLAIHFLIEERPYHER